MENPKQLLKNQIMHFFNGCKNNKCLSPDCKNFFIFREDLQQKRENKKNEGLPFVFEKIKNNEIQIFCVEEEQKENDCKMEKFKEIEVFEFHKFFFGEEEYKKKLEKEFRLYSEEIDEMEYETKEKYFEEINSVFLPKFEKLKAVLEFKPKELEFLKSLIEFIFLFEFILDIGNYVYFHVFQSFFCNLNFLDLYDKKMKESIKKCDFIQKEKLYSFIEKLQNNAAIIIMEKDEEDFNLEQKEVLVLKSIFSMFDFLCNLNKVIAKEKQINFEDFKNDDLITEKQLRFEIMEKIAANFKRNNKFISKKLVELIDESVFKDLKFLDYPFFFSVAKKADFLRFESKIHQELEIHQYFRKIAENPLLLLEDEDVYLELNLRRNSILEDAITQLHTKSKPSDLKKILKVKFENEPGVDEGGVTKEFFQILIQKLFDPDFGMFQVKNNRFLWFYQNSFACNLNFELVGVLLGLAFYNSTILDIKFPLVVYKKLKRYHFLEDEISYEDLFEFEPEIYTSLKNLLNTDFTGKETGITFCINYESWGENIEKELKPNGSEIDVTEENKTEFVELYSNWLLNESIKKEFDPFMLGFYKVMDTDIINMFSAEELAMAFCGKEELDFEELKKTARYDSGYNENSVTIIDFWDMLIKEFDEQEKKMFLKFLTGSDRAPLRGLSDLRITISRHGEMKQLPTSHTCFNHLVLPDYQNKELLKNKLKIAIKNYEGFGLL